MPRPPGVTIICILGTIGAILEMVGGIGLMAFAGLIGTGTIPGVPLPPSFIPPLFVGIKGAALLVLGIASLIALRWLCVMRRTGWLAYMGIVLVSIALHIATFSFGDVILPAIIVAYLWYVRKLFK
jgi:hypothetical protein